MWNTVVTRRRRILIVGASLALVGAVLAGSFQFVDDHRWYWSAAPVVCLIVVLAAACGGFLVGQSLRSDHNQRLWLIVAGSLFGVAWLGTGVLASSLAALGMLQYAPAVEGQVGWDSYTSAVLFNASHIRLLQSAAGSGLIGGIAVGLGLALRKVPGIEISHV